MHIICVGAVVTKDDQVLLVRQAKGHPLEGQWSIPWGYVDEDEFPDVAVYRETLEESDVEVEILGLIGIQELHDQGWIAIAFLCKYVQGSPTADHNGETDRAGFFSLDEIDKLGEPIEPWCEWIVRRVLEGKHIVIPMEIDNPYAPLKSFL
jgi:ADP-ribose pyrophosphatase YjhB (NUDIX family)